MKCFVIQYLFLFAISIAKFLKIGNNVSQKLLINYFVGQNYAFIDKMIEMKLVSFSNKNGIMYREHIPSINNYVTKKILFIGGRNCYKANNDFAELICKTIGIVTISFQYEGFYKSGKLDYVDEESYFRSIEEIYEMFSNNYDVYIIGYSMGCYGAVNINKRNNLLLISPFYSLQKTVRDIIEIKEFNLNNMLFKNNISIEIHTFNNDLINPNSYLTDNFIKDNIRIFKHEGNHVTGISDYLLNYIRRYINV